MASADAGLHGTGAWLARGGGKSLPSSGKAKAKAKGGAAEEGGAEGGGETTPLKDADGQYHTQADARRKREGELKDHGHHKSFAMKQQKQVRSLGTRPTLKFNLPGPTSCTVHHNQYHPPTKATD